MRTKVNLKIAQCVCGVCALQSSSWIRNLLDALHKLCAQVWWVTMVRYKNVKCMHICYDDSTDVVEKVHAGISDISNSRNVMLAGRQCMRALLF